MFTFKHTHRAIKIKIQELNGCFSCYIKNIQEDPKPLKGVSKSQVREFVVTDSRKEVVRGLKAIT